MLGFSALSEKPISDSPVVIYGTTAFGYISSGTNAGTGTNLTVAVGIAPVAGNILIATMALDSPTIGRTWPTGFTEQSHITTALDGQSLNWAYKIADGSEGSSFVLGAASSSNETVAVLVYGNPNVATPIETSTSNTNTTPAASPWNVTATGLSTGTAGRILVYIGGVDNATSGTVTSAAPSASPATWTQRVSNSNGTFTNLGIYEVVDTAGTFTSNVTSVQTGTGNADTLAFLIAIKPVAAGATSNWLKERYWWSPPYNGN